MSVEETYKELFEKGVHQKAIEYLRRNKERFDPALYHYNLGVNHARKNELALGRFHFEKAKAQGFYSPRLRDGLRHIKEVSGVSVLEEKGAAADYMYDWALSSSMYTGFNISLILLIILLTQIKKISHWWLKILLALIALTPAGGQLYIKSLYSQAVILEKKAVLAGPSAIFEQSQELLPAMKVSLSKDYNGWRYVVSPSSHAGWIRSGKLKEL